MVTEKDSEWPTSGVDSAWKPSGHVSMFSKLRTNAKEPDGHCLSEAAKGCCGDAVLKFTSRATISPENRAELTASV